MDIAQSRPRFRTDLVAQPIDEAGQRFVDVTDPDSGKTFRFYEVEYSIACAMNGQRDLDGLVDWAQAELGLEPSPEELQTVIDTLAELGYLDAEMQSTTSFSADFDLALGQAGVVDAEEEEPLPPTPELELGTAGASMASTDEVTFIAPKLTLGQAGNERVASAPPAELAVKSEQSFAGLMDDDEDQVPTTIKRPGQVTGNKDIVEDTGPAEVSSPDATPQALLRPVGAATDDDDDGPTNLPPPRPAEFDDEMSVDLSDHLKVGPDAVKEAVRQSKLMQAVDSAMDAGASSATPPAVPPVPRPEKMRDVAADEPRPVELPPKPISVSKPLEPLGEQSATATPKSRTWILVLVLFVVLAGAFALAYQLNLFELRTRLRGQGDTQVGKVEPTKQDVTQQDPTEQVVEKKPELPSAKLEPSEAPGMEVKAEQKGVLASIVASGAEVKEGDVVAKLKGGEKFEKDVAAAKERETYYQAKLDNAAAKKAEAEKAGNAVAAKKAQSEVDGLQKKVDEKRGLVTAAEEKLAAFAIKAPAAGTVETSLKANAAVSAGDVLFSIKGAPALKATFTVPESKEFSEDAEVEVVSKADDKKRLDCKVIKIEGQSVTVECPGDGGMNADEEVVLAP